MLFFSAPSAKSLILRVTGGFTIGFSLSAYFVRTGGKVRAMPSWISIREVQPSCVCAALQSHGPTGVSDATRYGLSGTERFSILPSNSTPHPANFRNQIGTYHTRTPRPLCRSEEHTSELQSLRHLVCR